MQNSSLIYESNKKFLFPEPSSTTVPINSTNHLIEQNVKIYPKFLVLTDPFEGKKFEEWIIITNIGTRPATVRIFQPSSSAIRIETLKQGHMLCSGMSIKRKMQYKVVMMTLIRSCVIPICINDTKTVHVEIKVLITELRLVPLPSAQVDFGFVDASPTPAKRTLTLANNNAKPCKFTIDLGPNLMDLFVEPSQGLIMGQSQVELKIELMLSNEGSKSTEFWIITENPICIQVKALVFRGKLETMFDRKMHNFTLVKFPITYFGIKSTKQLVVKNFSQLQSLFCIMGEIELETIGLIEARDVVDDFKYFSVDPIDGKLLPNDVRVFKFNFAPLFNRTSDKIYSCAMIRIHKLYCKDINAEEYDDGLIFHNKIPNIVPIKEEDTAENVTSDMGFQAEGDPERQVVNAEDWNLREILFEGDLRVMLYGQFESPSVSILPDEIVLSELVLNEPVNRILTFKNNSSNLPIYYRYKKSPCVYMKPAQAKLKPQERFEATVIVIPQSFQLTKLKLTFELLYHNVPRQLGNKLIVIGKIQLPLSYEVTIRKTETQTIKHSCAVIPKTFGNENVVLDKQNIFSSHEENVELNTQKTLVSKKSLKCLTKVNASKQIMNLYAKKLKCLKIEECKRIQKDYILTEFIPLSPLQLNQIIISPISSIIEMIAFNSTFLHSINIENRNDMALRVFLKSRKYEFYTFIHGDSFNIKARSTKEIFFMLTVGDAATNYCIMDVIVNNCHVFETSVLIKACPKHLSLSTQVLTFRTHEPNVNFVKLSNLLNVDIEYKWQVPPEFDVSPKEGQVASGKVQACMISYKLGEAESMVYNLGIHTENKLYSLRVIVEESSFKVTLPESVSFGNLSINIPVSKSLILTSQCNQRLSFEVKSGSLVQGVRVLPTSGWLLPFGTVYLTISILTNVVGEFKCPLDVVVSHTKHLICQIKGTVKYPQVNLSPGFIRFRRFAASSFDIACFTIQNTSRDTLANIRFDVERVPEFNYCEGTCSDFLTKSYVLTLSPGAMKQYSIHYYPYYPLVTSFSLPIIINGSASNTSVSQLSRPSDSSRVPSIKIYTQVLSHKIEVKSWRYTFRYYPHFQFKSTTQHTITIRNPLKTRLRFCIRLDELNEPFGFEQSAEFDRSVVRLECSFLCELAPGNQVIFVATFYPRAVGKYSIKLPLFIKDDINEEFHNYLYFDGTYPPATYSFDDEVVHLGFVPLMLTICKTVSVKMEFHDPDCNCEAFIDDPTIYLQIENAKIQGITLIKKIKIVFASPVPHLLYTKLRLFCDCGGKNFNVPVYGGSDNNYLTTHVCIAYFSIFSLDMIREFFENRTPVIQISTAHSWISMNDSEKDDNIKHTFVHDMPRFEGPKSPIYPYMIKVVAIMEKWLYEQVFHKTKSYSIPDTIAVPIIKTYGENVQKKVIHVKFPILSVLGNLSGSLIADKFDTRYPENKPISAWMRKIYKDMLIFLLSIGCYVNYVKPEYLLTYELYKDYQILMDREKSSHSEKVFLLLAKQAWLDILLQIYKVFVYKKVAQALSGLFAGMKKSALSLSFVSKTGMFFNETILCDQGMAILLWVDKHFQERKHDMVGFVGQKSMSSMLEKRHVCNFTTDLSDCLPIAAVILSYCPFFSEQMKELYVPTKNKEQNFHNAFIVISIFTKLQISFKIRPDDLTNPNPINMLMFLTYIYEFLIPLKAKDVVPFEAELSKKTEGIVVISNESQNQVRYSVILFENDDNLFSTNEVSVSLPPKCHTNITISYWAKFLRTQKSILYLCGETPGSRYANSRFYYLEGHYSLKCSSQEVTITSPIYKTITFQEKIRSPYDKATTYELYLCKNVVEGANSPEMIPYSSLLATTKTLARVAFDSPQLKADKNGFILLSGSICSIVTSQSSLCHIARSAEVGDFVFTFTINTKPSRFVVPLKLHMPHSLGQFPCTCPRRKPDPKNYRCPRNGILNIQTRNFFLWRAVVEGFLMGRPADEAEFWERNKKTVLASHIIHSILKDHRKYLTEDMDYFMKTNLKFDIRTRQKGSVSTEKTIAFDTEKTEYVDLPVHLTNTVRSFDLHLETVDKKETRMYRVVVLYDQ